MRFSIKPSYLISKLSFRKRITISLVVLSLLTTLYMGISSYRLSSDIILEMSKKLSENNFDIVYKSLDNYFKNVENNTTLLIRIPILREIIKSMVYKAGEQKNGASELYTSVREILNLASSNDGITFNTVNIYCKNGFNFSYYHNTDLPYSDYKSCLKYYTDKNYIGTGYKFSTWCEIIQTSDIYGQKSSSFINIRMLYDAAALEEVGVLVTGIDENDLYDIYSSFSDKAYILHKNGRTISHPDKTQLGIFLNDDQVYRKITGLIKPMDTLNISNKNKTQLITFKKLAYNNAFFIVPFDYYSGNEVLENKSFKITIIILILIGFLTSVILAMLFSKGLSASVLSLKKTVKAVYDGDLNARFKSDSNDEVSYLGGRFNEMLDQIKSLFTKQKEQENINKILELKLMQSQINPHLLYNSLDSTLWALDNKNITQAKDLIISLSQFFKISLSNGNSLIPLEKELEFASNYVNIQNISKNKNINFNVNIPDSLLQIPVIKLSIQPAVENSILHGFLGYREDGIINITYTSIDKNVVEITIEDNGIGISEQELADIHNTLESYPLENIIRHFGLYNVHRRIKNMFGNEYGIRLESEVGNYSRVIMRLPLYPMNKEEEGK